MTCPKCGCDKVIEYTSLASNTRKCFCADCGEPVLPPPLGRQIPINHGVPRKVISSADLSDPRCRAPQACDVCTRADSCRRINQCLRYKCEFGKVEKP